MDFRLLGPLEVFDDEGRDVPVKAGQQRALLAALLLRANEPVSTDVLVEQLWGESPPPTAHKMLHNHVSALRRALGANGRLETGASAYRLKLAEGERDVDRFEALVARGRARQDHDPEGAAEAFREALELWRGPPLADLAYEDFVQSEAGRLEELRLVAFEGRIDAELALGRHADVIAELEAAVAEQPYRERLRAQLMLALYRCDRQADALQAYRDARAKLVEELGIEPGERLRELERAILAQDPALAAPTPEAVDLPPELDTGTPLAGRETELDWLREHWRRGRGGAGRMVLVAGGPGLGKTRLAAELAAEVHRDRGAVRYVSGAGRSKAAREVLVGLHGTRRPTLLVLDDVDRADDEGRAALSELVGGLAALPVLVVATAEDASRAPVLGGDATLTLGPLDADGVRAVARRYAGARGDVEIPVEQLAAASGGSPWRVHRAAAEWGRHEAAQRLGATARRAASERTGLREAEDDLAGDVVELEAVRERADLLGGERSVVACPFKGLASFDVDDAEFFFGRERLVAELVARLAGAPVLGILGPSGSGKSSALRAGLVAALAEGVLPGSQGWGIALLRPGEHPLRALEEGTADLTARGRRVLAVDQFEEVFTACRDESERTAFIDALVAAPRDPRHRALVLVAIRADFYGYCAAYPELSRLLGANHVLVGPMRRDELRRAIEMPARRAGLHVEAGLVDVLVADVEGQPGALPLLSTALLELWQHRDGRHLRLSAYDQSGGVHGAVARLAERAYERLYPERREVARQILLRLAGEGEGQAVVRRRVPLADLGGEHDPRVGEVLAVLADDRLITVSESEVEVAHEALLREWPRLRDWLEEDREALRIHRGVTSAAQEWLRLGRDEGALYRGARLNAAVEWRDRRGPPLNELEREFLEVSDARWQRERAAHRRRVRIAFAALTAALGAITAVAAVALYQGHEAERQRDIAASRELAARATSLLDADPTLALALGLRALERRGTEQAENVVRQATFAARGIDVRNAHDGWVYAMAPSRDGRTVVTGGEDGAVRVWSVGAGRAVTTVPGSGDPIYGVSLSPDGGQIAAAYANGIVALYDADGDNRRVLLRSGPGNYGNSVEFSPDGSRLVVPTIDGAVRVIPADGRGPATVLRGHGGVVNAARFDSDGDQVVSAGADRTARIWDLAAGTSITLPHRTIVQSATFAPEGSRVATAGADGVVRIWDAGSRSRLTSFRAARQAVFSVRFSADGRRLVTGTEDGVVRLWDVAGGPPLGELKGHRGRSLQADFVPGSRAIVSAGEDGTLRLWQPAATSILRGPVNGVSLSSDGRSVVSGGTDGVVRVWDVETGRLRELRGQSAPNTAQFAPDGSQVIGASLDGTVRIWSLARGASRLIRAPGFRKDAAAFDASGNRIVFAGTDLESRIFVQRIEGDGRVVLRGHRANVLDVAFSPDGRHVLSASGDGTARIWSATTGKPERTLHGHHEAVNSAAFDEDGSRVVTAGADGTVRVWDLEGRRSEVMRGHEGAVYSAEFNGAGDRVVTAGQDGTVRVWDAAGGETLVLMYTHVGSATGADFSPDGDKVVSAGADGILRFTPCEVCGPLPAVLRLARSRADLQLSAVDRQRFLPSED